MITSGVPQGTILAPTLFSIFVKDLLDLELCSDLTAYADDIKIFGHVSPEKWLVHDLHLIEGWSIENNMFIKVDKSGVMHWGKKNPNHSYLINSLDLLIVSNYKDLGIVIDSSLFC